VAATLAVWVFPTTASSDVTPIEQPLAQPRQRLPRLPAHTFDAVAAAVGGAAEPITPGDCTGISRTTGCRM
jgi:hypothetical protein